MTAILIAIVGGACTAIPTIIATIATNNKSTALTIYRLEQLEKKVEKHNTVVERMAIAERDIKTMYTRIDEIRERR